MLAYFMVIWNILWPFGNVVVIWCIFPHFGILCSEKSGNPTPPSYKKPAPDLGDDDDPGDVTLSCAMLSSLGVRSTVILGVTPLRMSKERER
jgi:hypothetical protein